jgi:hypothetical protein
MEEPFRFIRAAQVVRGNHRRSPNTCEKETRNDSSRENFFDLRMGKGWFGIGAPGISLTLTVRAHVDVEDGVKTPAPPPFGQVLSCGFQSRILPIRKRGARKYPPESGAGYIPSNALRTGAGIGRSPLSSFLRISLSSSKSARSYSAYSAPRSHGPHIASVTPGL